MAMFSSREDWLKVRNQYNELTFSSFCSLSYCLQVSENGQIAHVNFKSNLTSLQTKCTDTLFHFFLEKSNKLEGIIVSLLWMFHFSQDKYRVFFFFFLDEPSQTLWSVWTSPSQNLPPNPSLSSILTAQRLFK